MNVGPMEISAATRSPLSPLSAGQRMPEDQAALTRGTSVAHSVPAAGLRRLMRSRYCAAPQKHTLSPTAPFIR